MQIKKKTIEQFIYVSENGRETPVREMNPVHLVNALLKAQMELDNANEGYNITEYKGIIKLLKDEVLYRIGANLDKDDDDSTA